MEPHFSVKGFGEHNFVEQSLREEAESLGRMDRAAGRRQAGSHREGPAPAPGELSQVPKWMGRGSVKSWALK